MTERIELRLPNYPRLLMVRMTWTHICRGSRDLQRQLCGKNWMRIKAKCSVVWTSA